MLLAIDAGNTNLVFALVEDGTIRWRWRIPTDARRTADEYAVWLHQLLALEGFAKGDVTAVIIGTVVPRALHNLEVLASKYFGVEPLVAGHGGSRSTSPSPARSAPTACSTRSPPMRSTKATSSSSISAPPPPSTWSTS